MAFITRATKGIGLETARGLGELGIAVIIGSRDEAKGRAAAETLKAEGIKSVEVVRFDVTKPADHKEIARCPNAPQPEAWKRFRVVDDRGDKTVGEMVNGANEHVGHHLKFIVEKRHALRITEVQR